MNNRRTATDFIEHSVSPWLRLLTPIGLTLIMFILANLNSNQVETRRELSSKIEQVQREVSNHSERIRANERSIEIYHYSSP